MVGRECWPRDAFVRDGPLTYGVLGIVISGGGFDLGIVGYPVFRSMESPGLMHRRVSWEHMLPLGLRGGRHWVVGYP